MVNKIKVKEVEIGKVFQSEDNGMYVCVHKNTQNVVAIKLETYFIELTEVFPVNTDVILREDKSVSLRVY